MKVKLQSSMKTTTSPYIVVKRSSIHSNGVFAKKDIPKGTKIIEYVGEKITKAESDKRADMILEDSKKCKEKGAVYIFQINKKYDIDGSVSWNTARFINHSCDPNCETEDDDGHIWIMAIKNIKKGEELSYDYCYDLDSYEDHPCRCGSKNCCGYIVVEGKRAKLKKMLEKKKKNNNKK